MIGIGDEVGGLGGLAWEFVFWGDPVKTSRDLNNKELEKKISGCCGNELWGKEFQHWTPSLIPSSCTTSKISGEALPVPDK